VRLLLCILLLLAGPALGQPARRQLELRQFERCLAVCEGQTDFAARTLRVQAGWRWAAATWPGPR
jgi:hypothetical protein